MVPLTKDLRVLKPLERKDATITMEKAKPAIASMVL